MVYKEQTLRAEDGLKLNIYRWLPENPKGAIVLSHGWSEHAGRYDQVAKWFSLQGYEVHALDHRGHGKSEGVRGHVDCWNDYARDLETLRATVEHDAQYLLGHSMGGMISVRHLLNFPRRFRAVALSGPATDVSYAVPKLKVYLSRGLSRILPKLQFNGEIDPSCVCANEAIVKDYMSDPLNHGKVSARWFARYLALIEEVKNRAVEIDVPIAIWHGEGDSLVAPWVSEAFYHRLEKAPKQRQVVPEAMHEILFEDQWQDVARAMLEWMEQH